MKLHITIEFEPTEFPEIIKSVGRVLWAETKKQLLHRVWEERE